MFKFPAWLKRDKIQLPPWAKVVPFNDKLCIRIEADPDGYIPEWLELLEVKKPDQYWLEVAYQCAKLDLQACLAGTDYDPRTAGKAAEFHFLNRPQWALNRHPKGRGINAASKGKEARAHYRRIRGPLPF